MALPAIRNIMERKSVRSYDSRTVEEEKIDAKKIKYIFNHCGIINDNNPARIKVLFKIC